MTTGSLSEYMVRKSDEFNIRVDIIEQRISNMDEKLSAMEYNVNRLVDQLEVLLDKLPYTKPTAGETSYEKYLKSR